MGDVADHRTWNVFRRLNEHGLCGAVPADAPVPMFLLTGDWTFGYQFTRGDAPVPGFSPQSAEIGIRLNGFYLFLGFGSRLALRPRPSFPTEASGRAEPNEVLAHSPDATGAPDTTGRGR